MLSLMCHSVARQELAGETRLSARFRHDLTGCTLHRQACVQPRIHSTAAKERCCNRAWLHSNVNQLLKTRFGKDHSTAFSQHLALISDILSLECSCLVACLCKLDQLLFDDSGSYQRILSGIPGSGISKAHLHVRNFNASSIQRPSILKNLKYRQQRRLK